MGRAGNLIGTGAAIGFAAAASFAVGWNGGMDHQRAIDMSTGPGPAPQSIAPPVEGRVVRGEHGVDVGDRMRVRLVATEPTRGFIDFARA